MTEALNPIGVALRCISSRAEEVYNQVCQAGGLSIDGNTSSADIDVAMDLEKYGFIFRRIGQAGYDLLPTPFALLVPSLLHRIDWKYPPFVNLPPHERERLQHDLLQLPESALKSVLPPTKSGTMPQTIEGAANIDAFVARILHEAQDVRAVSAAEWSSNLPLVWAALVQRMGEGMHYQRVTSPLGLAAFGWDINNRDISETGVDLRVSLTRTISPFYIFTGDNLRSTLVFVSPVRDDTQPRATYTTLGQLTERLSSIFDDLWCTAIPAQAILNRLRTYRPLYVERARQKCGEVGAHVAGALFDKGIFATFSADEEALLPRLIGSGLAVRSKYIIGNTPYVPNIVKEIEVYFREERGSNDEWNI